MAAGSTTLRQRAFWLLEWVTSPCVCVVVFWDQDSMPFWDQLEVERQRESTPTQHTHTCVCCMHMTPHPIIDTTLYLWFNVVYIPGWCMALASSRVKKVTQGQSQLSHCLIATNLYKTLSPSLIMSRKPLMWTPRVSIRTLAELCMWWQCSWQSHLLLYAGLYLFVL